MRPIKVERQDENQTVMANGLTPSEKVVTTGFARLTEGAKVTIGSDNPAATPTQPQGAKAGNGRQRGGNGSRPAAQQ
jgi:multidrug efflux system membrane fusion protein